MPTPRVTSGTPKGKPRGRRAPVSDETRARMRQLAAEGMTRNAIARELGLSAGTITRNVPRGTFDRSATAAATEARTHDLKAMRVDLSREVLTEARRLVGLMSAPATVYTWSKDGELLTDTLDRPTAGDVRNYAVAAAVLTDKHLALVRVDSDDRDLPAVEAWLQAMMGSGSTAVNA